LHERALARFEENGMKNTSKQDVFVDVCVQREYLTRNGTPACTNADLIINNSKHLMAYARLAKIPVISCVDVDRGNRIGSEFVSIVSRAAPEDRKTAFTLLPHRILIESDNSLSVPLDLLQHYQQAIFTKIHRDPFTNPKLDRMLTEMPARRFIVFGIPLEQSLRILVLGLLRRKRRVTLLTDTCGYWNVQEADMVLRQLSTKGCELSTARAFLAHGLLRLARQFGIRLRPSRSVA
jgi:nicotinamidase-related amidase